VCACIFSVIRKDTPDGQTGVTPGTKADTVQIPKEVADQLTIAQRLIERYHDALRGITE
jgi:hypothetical protein